MSLCFFDLGQDFITLIEQADVNTDVTGDWVSMRNYSNCTLVIMKLGSEDVDTLGFQVYQATSNSGGSAKGVSALFPYRYKQGTMTGQGTWTYGQLSTADDILGVGSAAPTGGTLVVSTDTNTDAFILCIDVQAAMLDVDNEFDWLTVNVEGDEVNNSCLITAIALLGGSRYPQRVPLSPI